MDCGYIILDLNAENVYEQALECATNGKPVLINFNGESFYADSVEVSGSDVIVTALNRTYTIDNTNQVVLTDTTPHLYGMRAYDSDIDGDFILNIPNIDLYVDSSATELTEDQASQIKRIYDYLVGDNLTFALSTNDSSWSSPSVNFRKADSSLIITFRAIVSGTTTSGRYIFDNCDTTPTIDSITDETFNDGINLKSYQIF